MFTDKLGSNDPSWTRGWFDVNLNGVVTGGARESSDGSSGSITDGSLSIDGGGLVDGWLEFGGVETNSFSDFKLDPGKTVIAGVDSDDTSGDPAIVVVIKGGGSFVTADLEGRWRVHSYSDNAFPQSSHPSPFSADLIVDATGAVTGGPAFTGGSFSIDSDGFMDGWVEIAGVEINSTSDVKMDPGKTVLVGADINDTEGDPGISVSVPEPEGVLLQLAGLASLLMLTRWRRALTHQEKTVPSGIGSAEGFLSASPGSHLPGGSGR
jgi:hypothetical protein